MDSLTDKKNDCPDRIEILAWLDGEFPDESEAIAAHAADCSRCRKLAEKIRAENTMIRSTLESLGPMPDLSEKIMSEVLALAAPVKNYLYPTLLLIFILSASSGLFILFRGITGFFISVSWSVALIKAMSFAAGLIDYGSILLGYVQSWAFSGKPLLPSLTVTVLVLLINTLQKRRIFNV